MIHVAAIQLFFVQIDNLEPMPVVRGYSICLAIVFSIEYVLHLFVCVEDPHVAESFPSAVRSRCPRTRIRFATALSPMMLLDVITIISLLPIPERYKGCTCLVSVADVWVWSWALSFSHPPASITSVVVACWHAVSLEAGSVVAAGSGNIAKS